LRTEFSKLRGTWISTRFSLGVDHGAFSDHTENIGSDERSAGFTNLIARPVVDACTCLTESPLKVYYDLASSRRSGSGGIATAVRAVGGVRIGTDGSKRFR
jgi:hypothetical protein